MAIVLDVASAPIVPESSQAAALPWVEHLAAVRADCRTRIARSRQRRADRLGRIEPQKPPRLVEWPEGTRGEILDAWFVLPELGVAVDQGRHLMRSALDGAIKEGDRARALRVAATIDEQLAQIRELRELLDTRLEAAYAAAETDARDLRWATLTWRVALVDDRWG